jgi:hypothetical protein
VLGLVVAACIINWFVTFLFIDGLLFATPRNWVVDHTWYIYFRGERVPTGRRKGGIGFVFPEGTTQEEADVAAKTKHPHGPWLKPSQLITCAACLRVWIGFAEAAFFGGPFGHWYAIIANGLLFAGGGHLLMEARSKVAA